MKIYKRLSSIIDLLLSTVLVFLVMIPTLSKEAYAAEPVANAGTDQIQVKTQLLSFEAVLNGVESYDPDGSSLTYQWYGPFDPVTGPAPAVSVPEGRYTVSLLVDDGMTMSLPDTTTIEIIPCFSLTAMARDRRVILGWSPQGSNILYEIYRSGASDPRNFVKIGETTSEHSAYADYGVTNYTTYLYIVKANLQGRSCYSSVVSGQPFAGHSAPAVNPVIYSSPILYGATGIIYNYDVNATGAQHYSLSVFPFGMTIDPATGLIAWIPDVAGTFDVTVDVSNGQGGTATQSYILDITAQPVRGPEVFICVEPFREQTPQPPEPDCAREEYATSYGLITGLVNERTLTVTLNGVVLPDGEEIYDAGSIVIGMRNADFYWAFVQIPDVDGTYPFTAVAWDALGNYRDATANFIRDTVPPEINITDPLDGIVVNTPTVTITGVVDDPEALVYEGYYGPLIPVVDGVFEVDVALDEGPNGFIFQAEDAAGNQGSATVRITLDTIPPQIDITSPVEGGAMNTVTIAVSGLVIDENINTVTVSANGDSPQPLTITGQGFSGTVALSSGWNTLLFEATDRVGNAVQQTRTVLLDMLSPTLAITSPTSGASVSGIIQVTMEASDLQSGVSGVSLLVDGQPYNATAQVPYTFDLDMMAYAAGVHTLTARATDTAGNISEASIDIDILPQMQLEILSPLDGVTVNHSPLLVKGSIIHNLREVGVVINGVIAQVNGDEFAAEVYLEEGVNTITITATDGAGLEVSASISVTLTPEASSLSLTIISTSGIEPLEVTFEAETSIANPVSNYQWDIDGNGTIDTSGATLSTITNTYPNPGLYFPRVIVTDNLGNIYEQATVVNVLSAANVDALLQAKWEEMRAALTNGDVEGALRFFGADTQEIYRAQFTALSPVLNIIGSELGEIRFITLQDHRAEYEITVARESVTYSYYLLFEMDINGIWKIRWF